MHNDQDSWVHYRPCSFVRVNATSTFTLCTHLNTLLMKTGGAFGAGGGGGAGLSPDPDVDGVSSAVRTNQLHCREVSGRGHKEDWALWH